jgi:CheY-like chemotaxis protein
VARVFALIPDLLFGSQVQGQLAAAGHEVALIGDPARLGERLAASGDALNQTQPVPTVLVVDLTQELDGAALVRDLTRQGALAGVHTLGFYAHVDPAVRERALQAGFDLVVPRSRMAREGSELVARLAAAGSST